jgi:hypothetical protein
MQAEEIWKDIPEYEGLYQVSNLGRVKSLERTVIKFGKTKQIIKDRILKEGYNPKRYYNVTLCKKGTKKSFLIHLLVARTFKNHIPNGYKLVVDHKDFDKLNNREDNLRIITQRENANRKHLKSSSKYTGVGWNKKMKKWMARIALDGKDIYLGSFIDEHKAHLAYEEALLLINQNKSIQPVINKYKHKFISEYKGVTWLKLKQRWISRIYINNKVKHLGSFKNEIDAHLAYQTALKQKEYELAI